MFIGRICLNIRYFGSDAKIMHPYLVSVMLGQWVMSRSDYNISIFIVSIIYGNNESDKVVDIFYSRSPYIFLASFQLFLLL